jgi:hypothetical protein
MQALRAGPSPPKNGSSTSSPGVAPGAAEEHPDRGRVERLADTHVGGDLLHHVVGRGADRVLGDTEHPLRLVVVRRQLVAPVGDAGPLRVGVELLERLVEGVGVDQRPAADTGARDDEGVADGIDALDAVAPDRGRPQVALHVERAGGEVLVAEPRPRLEDADPVALLGQPQRRDGPAEAGPDDQDVEVEVGLVAGLGRGAGRLVHGQALPSFFISRRLAVITVAYASLLMPSIGANRSRRCVPTACDSV